MDLASTTRELFEAYRSFQEMHPHLGAIASAETMFVTGDVVSQLLLDGKVDGRKVGYTAALAPLYGLCTEVLLGTGDLVDTYVSSHPLAKAALGPNLWGNLYNTFFFVNNAVGERSGYSIEKLLSHYRGIVHSEEGTWRSRIREQYLKLIPLRGYAYSTVGTVTVWNAFQWGNYEWVAPELRTTTTLAAGLVWMSLMSLWSLKGRRKILAQKI